jgi:hypothetical protein
MSDIIDMLKTEFDKASSGSLKGPEGMLSKLDFKHSVDSSPLAEDDEESIESNEGMGAASAGGYSAPLFSKVEAKEATSSSSVGAYDAPGFEDVKMRGNHHRGSGRSYKKTQIPGGKFVEVKSKCKKFPYCNQGIGAIKLYGGKKLKEAISNVSKKMNISEDTIREIIAYEYRNLLSK